jgi:arylsulfatase A-like enzyme
VIDPTSFLFITLDSCRYDTFASADAPNLKRIGPLHRAIAPGNFTFPSHAAMFVGFTPGDATRLEPYVNPKFAKIFRMEGGGTAGKAPAFVTLNGRNVVDGLKRLGYLTLGSGAVGWFNPGTRTGRTLSLDFDDFFFAGNMHSLQKQLDWIDGQIAAARTDRLFVFLNVGETHLPYYFEGAPWPRLPSPCLAFGEDNDAEESRRRQRACLEWVDAQLGGLLDRFSGANVVVCADHGDAWGEDGLWEHGFHHRKVLEVPLLFRLTSPPTEAARVKRPLWRRASSRARRTLVRLADTLPA